MPTNILRSRGNSISARPAKRPGGVPAAKRRVLIKAGRVSIRAELLDTETANRIWTALPLYSTAETWGNSIHFETPVETGRERGARANSEAGDICFWTEDDRIIIGFGPTPISKSGEIRLPRPCNIWAKAMDDVTLLKTVVPGEKVSVTAV
jgi:hypothetical protein